MLLVINVENTNTVLGAYDGKRLLDRWTLQTQSGRTVDELGVLVRQLFETRALDPALVDGAMISCVTPTVQPTVTEMVERYFGVIPLIVGPGVRTGMPILSDNPREVGADRIVNAVAAYQLYQDGLVVVNLGTAATFDVISPDGEYLGGAIAPGMTISAEALFERTSKLPRVELRIPDTVLGRNTVTSMQAGIYFGYVGLVEELILRMTDELSFDVHCVATGELAELIAAEVEAIDDVEPELTLIGLRILYERNTASSSKE